jgi:BRCT domain type II-containing protein
VARRKASPLDGKRVVIRGKFATWPGYHGEPPDRVARRHGAIVAEKLDASVDVIVLGDKPGAGRAEAVKKAARLQAVKPGFQLLDEASFKDLVRADLNGKTFAFTGGFDCAPEGLEHGLLAKMVETVGAKVQTEIDGTLDYLVVGNRRGDKKVATRNKAKKLQEEGAKLVEIDERGFLELVRVERPAAAGGALDFAGFVNQLYATLDEGKLGRALKMLKGESFKLYSRVDDQRLVGVVKSQSGSGNVYASWLKPEGKYGCSSYEGGTYLDCMGLQGSPCKHLLVLLIGLVRTAQLPVDRGLAWIRATRGKQPGSDLQLAADTFLQYMGALAGEVDWRPLETIPEDYYAL